MRRLAGLALVVGCGDKTLSRDDCVMAAHDDFALATCLSDGSKRHARDRTR
jgi:hypothetical protein